MILNDTKFTKGDTYNHNIVKIILYYEYNNTQDSVKAILPVSLNCPALKEIVRIDFVYETENWKFAKMQHYNDVEYYTKFEKEILSLFYTTKYGDSQPYRTQLYTIFFLLCD